MSIQKFECFINLIFNQVRKALSDFINYLVIRIIRILRIIFLEKEFIFLEQDERSHRKLTAACQTKAKRKKSKGMTGIKSTIGLKKA